MFFSWYYEKLFSTFMALLPVLIMLAPFMIAELCKRFPGRGMSGKGESRQR
ncbi:hypothetical protein NDK47_21765 [Brevibacillus ruminantium]|uniref:Uncharacterized protein n=1 Tax=Brevibacillus ruminantium TaxID=2950604 RepID=A0ABY4WCZ9_9BACL|nr:hypothetical protein [Brevibacillus ruminantium]USG64726.1 hypothetical protein NDK47_21765 [Brevibacillus ruminantium]